MKWQWQSLTRLAIKTLPKSNSYNIFSKTYCGNISRALHKSCITHGYNNSHSFSTSTTCRSYVELTSVRYKDDIERGSYATVEHNDVSFFTGLLGKSRVITDSSDLEGYNVDWLRTVRGASTLLLRPKTTQEVSAIIKYCNERRLAVCPQGGNTGIVGGSTPLFDEIIISTSLMNEIISLNDWSGVLVCQSGCVLDKLNEYLQERGLLMPLDLGAKDSCQIGGNVSTNAGGLRVLRYGSLHSTILGVEVVLADGTILDCMSSMKKDNTGYDLKHLFIGSEGTLGIVTKVAIQCPANPNAVNLAFLGMNDYKCVLETFKRAKRDLGEVLSACEYIDHASVQGAIDNLHLKIPIEEFPFYMAIETSGSKGTHDEEKLNVFLEDAMAHGVVSDGTITSQPSHMRAIWQVRERLPEALMIDGYLYVFDFSIPLDVFDELVVETREYLGSAVKRVTGFGHLGDGNIHLNITTEKYDADVTAKVEPFLYNWVSKRKGSISAEHGLGFKKRNDIHYSKSPQSIEVMKNMKKLFDPKMILNPYKVLPSQSKINHDNSDSVDYS